MVVLWSGTQIIVLLIRCNLLWCDMVDLVTYNSTKCYVWRNLLSCKINNGQSQFLQFPFLFLFFLSSILIYTCMFFQKIELEEARDGRSSESSLSWGSWGNITRERIFRYFCERLILTQSFLYVYPFYYCFSVSMFELL
jgi:hypothetical protein